MFDLASLIRFHRKKAHMNQIELAELAGVSRKVVQEIESGHDAVAWKNVLAVLETLNVSLHPRGPLVESWRNSQPTETSPADERHEAEE